MEKLKNSHEFKKCDDLAAEIRKLLKEKAHLQCQNSLLQRKEARSKWYKSSNAKKPKLKEGQPRKQTEIEGQKSILESFSTEKHAKPCDNECSNSSQESGDTLIIQDEQGSNDDAQELKESQDF